MSSPLPVLVGELVTLARLRRDDVPDLAHYFHNLELTTYLNGSGVSYSLEDEQAYFEAVSRNTPAQVTFGV